VLDDDAHRGRLGLGIRLKPADIRRLSLRVREDEHACHPLNTLERQRSLAIQVRTTTIPSVQQFGMTRLGLRQTTFCTWKLLVDVRRRAPDLIIGALEQLGEGQIHMRRNALDLG
jgi:hypothetical protein